MKTYFVYMLTNWNNKVMYIGVTNNLERRMHEHKNKLIKGFTSKYNLTKLVFFEEFSSIDQAIASEKKIKGWIREKKDALVSVKNPNWDDLSMSF